MIRNGPYSDSQLEYNGIIANYWTVEDGLYDLFKEDLRESNKLDEYLKLNQNDSDVKFNDWLRENEYLLDDIFTAVKHDFNI